MIVLPMALILFACVMSFLLAWWIKDVFPEGITMCSIVLILILGVLGFLVYINDYSQYGKIAGCVDNGGNVQWCVDNHWKLPKDKDDQFLKHIKYEIKEKL